MRDFQNPARFSGVILTLKTYLNRPFSLIFNKNSPSFAVVASAPQPVVDIVAEVDVAVVVVVVHVDNEDAVHKPHFVDCCS